MEAHSLKIEAKGLDDKRNYKFYSGEVRQVNPSEVPGVQLGIINQRHVSVTFKIKMNGVCRFLAA